MQVIVKNKTLIKGICKEKIDQAKNYLTISNPEFYKKMDMKLYHWDIEQDLKYYDTPTKDSILIPVGSTNEVLKLISDDFPSLEENVNIKDQRVTNAEHKDFFKNLEFTGILRDYQQQVHDICMGKTVGVVEAMTGSGKTICFTALIVSRAQPTLVMVNTLELANQTIDAICNFTNLQSDQIGFIGDGRFELKPITVALHQSLSRLDDSGYNSLNSLFGQIIADEVHIIAAETFYNNMGRLNAKYKFGFSATPRREDGLTKVIHFAAGPKIHKVPESSITKYVTIPTYRQVETGYNFFLVDTTEYQLMLTDMAEDAQRNQIILDEMAPLMNYSCCLLCRRTSQVDYLAQQLGENAVALTSKVKKKDRKKIMAQVKAKKKNILVSTFGLMSTGIDVPHFEKLLYCGPVKSETKIRQSAGRLMRQDDGKSSAEIIDFTDKSIHVLRHQANTRKRVIQKLINELKNG